MAAREGFALPRCPPLRTLGRAGNGLASVRAKDGFGESQNYCIDVDMVDVVARVANENAASVRNGLDARSLSLKLRAKPSFLSQVFTK
jgi:hypothetical protein